MIRATRLDKVFESAIWLFSNNGFTATSVQQVAKRSRISKAGLYYHVSEKEDLLFRICHYSISSLLSDIRNALKGKEDPIVRLRTIIQTHADFFLKHPHHLVVLNQQMRYLSPWAAPADRTAGTCVSRSDPRDGSRRPSTKHTAALQPDGRRFLDPALLNTLDRWYDPRGSVRPSELVNQIEQTVLHGLTISKSKGQRQ